MNKDILEKYFSGKASEAEVQKVLNWFDARELNPQKMQTLEDLWRQVDESDFVPHDGERILRNIHQQIKANKESQSALGKRLYLKISHRANHDLFIWGKAASILILVGAFALWEVNDRLGNTAEQRNARVMEIAKAGEQKILKLSDRTTVHLNAESKIIFREHFSKTKRKVFLTGEAFFEVEKDPGRPFIVHTGALKITVFGTSFNIRSYDNDETMGVSLATGKLKVELNDTSDEPKAYILNPGEAAVLNKKRNFLGKTRFDPQASYGWIHGVLVFQDADIDQILTKLERWYGVSIEVENGEAVADREWKYRGVFKNESLENVLKGISYIKNFTYEIENKDVKITF